MPDYQKYQGHQNLEVTADPIPLTFTEKTLNGLYQASEVHRETVQILAHLSERLFGQLPEGAAKDGPVPVACGKADETDMAVRDGIRYAQRIRDMTQDLANRI